MFNAGSLRDLANFKVPNWRRRGGHTALESPDVGAEWRIGTARATHALLQRVNSRWMEVV
jgi:hypothetical protein